MAGLTAAFIAHPSTFTVVFLSALLLTALVLRHLTGAALVLARGWPPEEDLDGGEALDGEDLPRCDCEDGGQAPDYLCCASCGGTLGVASPHLVE